MLSDFFLHIFRRNPVTTIFISNFNGYDFSLHYENMPMQYKEIFKVVKNENFPLKIFDIFLIFAQNIDCGYTLAEAVLTSTHNLCFGAKIRKIGILLHTPVLLYKSGVQGGIHYTDMFHDVSVGVIIKMICVVLEISQNTYFFQI